MKKTAAFLAALVLVLSLSLSALADTSNGTVTLDNVNTTKSIDVSFVVDESYTVTIPSKLELGTDPSATANISINPKLNAGKELRVYLDTTGWDSNTFYDQTGNTVIPSPDKSNMLGKINYSVIAGGNTLYFNLTNSTNLLRYYSTDKKVLVGCSSGTTETNIGLTFSTTEADESLAPGTYSYTQTFKIAAEPSYS